MKNADVCQSCPFLFFPFKFAVNVITKFIVFSYDKRSNNICSNKALSDFEYVDRFVALSEDSDK